MVIGKQDQDEQEINLLLELSEKNAYGYVYYFDPMKDKMEEEDVVINPYKGHGRKSVSRKQRQKQTELHGRNCDTVKHAHIRHSEKIALGRGLFYGGKFVSQKKAEAAEKYSKTDMTSTILPNNHIVYEEDYIEYMPKNTIGELFEFTFVVRKK